MAAGGRVISVEARAPRFVLSWGAKGDRPGEFFSPIGIAIDQRDRVYVTDLNNARLQIFSSGGRSVGGFDLPRDTPERRSSIVGGIAIGPDGLIYLSFMSRHCMGVYTKTGQLVREWGKRGSGDGELFGPGGLCFAKDGSLYVADQNNHRILRFSPGGELQGKWGEHGPGAGQFGGSERRGSRFAGPHFITRDSKGRFYTTEGVLGRVQQFSQNGKPLLAWGTKGDEPGGFGSYKFGVQSGSFGPIAAAVDQNDRVWVSSLNDRVQAFSTEGKYLFGITTSGPELGCLQKPHGMAFDSRGDLYVADAHNQRIQRFRIP
jgi:sugar lactone lactonase YvrE